MKLNYNEGKELFIIVHGFLLFPQCAGKALQIACLFPIWIINYFIGKVSIVFAMSCCMSCGTVSNKRTGLEIFEQAFPNKSFSIAAIHEFLTCSREDAAATNTFITCLLNKLIQRDKYCIWVTVRRAIYPPALKRFGIDADRIIFIDADKNMDALWAIEEALKCDQIAVVVGEVPDLSFTESRRLQLAVENSRVTGLIHRSYPRQENTVACVSRWQSER